MLPSTIVVFKLRAITVYTSKKDIFLSALSRSETTAPLNSSFNLLIFIYLFALLYQYGDGDGN